MKLAVSFAALCRLATDVVALDSSSWYGSFGGISRTSSHVKDDELPTCTCDCCDTVARLPEEYSDGVRVKCAPSNTHSSDVCQDHCAPADDDKILRTSEIQDLDYLRFCFFECKPANGVQSPVTTQCIMLEDGEAERVLDRNGNIVDPAFLYARPAVRLRAVNSRPRVALIGRRQGERDAAPAPAPAPGPGPLAPGEISPEEARKAAQEGIRWSKEEGADARVEASKVRQLEAAAALNANANLREQLGEPPMNPQLVKEQGLDPDAAEIGLVDPYGAITDIRAAAKGAQSAAAEAALAAQDALKAVQSARSQSWRKAIDTTNIVVANVQNSVQAEVQAKADAAKPSPWVQGSANAAKVAAAPWVKAELQSQTLARNYEASATETGARANQLAFKATNLAREANQVNRMGLPEEANEKILDARNIADQAQKLSEQAEQMVKTAESARAAIPMYAAQANYAAYQAASGFQPKFNPPGLSPPEPPPPDLPPPPRTL